MRLLITAWLLVPFVAVIFPGNTKAGDTEHKHFDRTIAPLLAQHCLSCHSGVDPKGELDLSTQESAMRGGESGVVIVPGELDASPLWQYVESDEMPPKKPLSSAEKETLKAWIVAGAKWGTKRIDPFRYSTDARAGVDWWSLQPLRNPELPSGTHAGWTKIAIDAFVHAKRTSAGLEPSPEADRRTLIRRLSFDLLGLPPTPQQLDLFLSDNSANAYETLVDRMLESPHYGERWARHWLDIVRFGESNGFEYDQPRDNAWHYRNWVINALNDDMPYDEFVRLQLAGDLIRPNDLNAVAAAGFLVAGPHNTTLPANDKMRMTMAQDEMEDLVGIVGQTFLGLTINCSRCHDHKFDPISQKEYYQFAATLSGVTHGERNVAVPLTKTQQQRLADIEKRSAAIQRELTAIELPARESILLERKNSSAAMPEPPQPLAIWEFDEDFNDRMGDLHGDAIGGAKIEDGCLVLDGTDAFVATKPLGVDLTEKTLEAWVQLTNDDQRGGGVISVQTLGGGAFDAIVFGEREPKKWMAGSNSFVRTQPFNGPEDTEATQRFVHMAIVYQKDGTIIGYRDGQTYGNAYRPGELQFYAAGQSQVVFGMRHSPAGGNRMLAGRIQRAQLYARALAPDEVAASAGVANLNYVSTAQLLARLTAEQRSQHEQLNAESAALQAEKESMTKSQQVSLYTCVSKNPGVSRLLLRGDVGTPAEEVAPSALSAVAGMSADFGLTMDASDADRRVKLAQWVTHSDNPLFARVIVNRLWHYHFGQGLIATPSDFGFNGGQSSHPELLDWLAQALKANNYRLKPLHRLIVTSATYRQASKTNVKAAKIDADNRLLWRKSPLRLEAEEIRDAVLVATGQLDETIGGIGYRDVRHFPFKGSNFYESINESTKGKLRRTIYRFSPRGGRNPFLDTFDCPDPSATSPKRASTTTPLQALALMNNDLVFQMADKFAVRVRNEAGDNSAQQIVLVYEIAYGRKANEAEVEIGSGFVSEHGLPSYCRIILNSNEFLYVQ